jgi:hypothetical protein
MKHILFLVLVMILLFSMTACTSPNASIQIEASDLTIHLSLPGPNPMVNQPDGQGRVARAVVGLWHGLIVPVTLVLSFFDSNVEIYGVHNTGSEYNFGFFLGEAIAFALIGLFLRSRRSAWSWKNEGQ